MNNLSQYMADFDFPINITERFLDLIAVQRSVVNQYFREGKLASYAISFERGKLWAVFNAASEFEVMEMLADFPLTAFMGVEITMLNQFDRQYLEPAFSKN